MTAVVLVHHDDYADWVFDSHHPTQGRRFTQARELLLGGAGGHLPDAVTPLAWVRMALKAIG